MCISVATLLCLLLGDEGVKAWSRLVCSPLRGESRRRAGRGVKAWSRQRSDPLRLASLGTSP